MATRLEQSLFILSGCIAAYALVAIEDRTATRGGEDAPVKFEAGRVAQDHPIIIERN